MVLANPNVGWLIPECLGSPTFATAETPSPDYWRSPDVRQPHAQSVAWQRHRFPGHPQEQVAQSHVPQQVVFLAASLGVLIWFVIVFSLFFQRLMRFQRG